MPYGIVADIVAIALGGLLGGLIGNHLSESFKAELNNVIGVWALSLGIALVPKVQIFGAVMLSLSLSYIIGYALDFDGHVNALILGGAKRIFKGNDAFDINTLSVLIVLMTFGGSGIVGAMTEAMTGDTSIILARAVADLITVTMFATTLGTIAGIAAIPCTISLFAFYFCAKLIMPLMTDAVYANFMAVGGILNIISALRMFKVSKAKPMNAVLVVLLVVPITMLWQRFIG